MKTNTLLFSIAVFCVSFLKAQPEAKADTTIFRVGENTQIIYVKSKEPVQEEIYFKESTDGDIYIGRNSKGRRSKKTFFTGLDLGVNLLSQNNELRPSETPIWETEPAKSLYWGINLLKAEFKIIGQQYLYTGLGINYRSFHFVEEVDIFTSTDTTQLRPTALLQPKKNKLRATYLHVPLMLSFNTSDQTSKNFHISLGVEGNLRIGSIFKQKYRQNGDTEKRKIRDDFNLAPYLVDASVRIGFSNVTLFAKYGLTPLFREGKAPEMQPITFGVQLLGF